MVLSSRYKIDKLMRDLDDIVVETAGKSKKSKQRDEAADFEDVKGQIMELLNEARMVVDTLQHRKGDAKDKEDFALERQVDGHLISMRSLLGKLEEKIKQAAPKKLSKPLKQKDFIWRVACIANGDEDGESGWTSWLPAVAEVEEFSEISGGSSFADLVSFQQFFQGEDKEVQAFMKYCDRDRDSKVGAEDFYVTRKEVRLFVRKCRGLLLLKKQVDFIDYRHKPHRFRRNAKNSKGYGGVGGGKSNIGKGTGKASQALNARRERASNEGASYRPVEPTQQEQQFLQKSAQWEEQLNEQLKDVIQSLKRLQVVADDVRIELDEQEEVMNELDDRMQKVDEIIGTEIDRLQDLLDRSGGMSTWCPRIIAGVIAFAVIGYLLKGK